MLGLLQVSESHGGFLSVFLLFCAESQSAARPAAGLAVWLLVSMWCGWSGVFAGWSPWDLSSDPPSEVAHVMSSAQTAKLDFFSGSPPPQV